MSAGTSFIRLRLHFDYPPPAAVGCRMCWLLVDVNTCRVVADLESTIRERFGFSRGSIFNLFIQDCYLPHTENIYVVRDNDDIRVKVESLAQVNGHGGDPDESREKRRKRQRGSEDDGPGENGAEAKCKKKKKKKRCEENVSEDVASVAGDGRSQRSAGKKHTEKKKKKKKNGCATSPLKTPTTVDLAVKGKKKLPASPVKRQNPPSSDSSSSSSDEVSKKPASKTPSSTPAASRTPPNTKPTQKKPQPPSSSSSDTETSSDEAPRPTTSDSLLQSTSGVQKPAAEPQNRDEEEDEEEEEEEIKLVIKKPLPPGRIFAGRPPQQGRGRGRGGPGGPGPGQQGPPETSRTVRVQNGPESRYGSSKEPSYRTDSLVNKSVVLQNGAESFQKRDYSSMPLLAAPPQVGQKIAFKLLELTENYTPEVSEYKEGKIVSFDPATKQMELELLSASQAPTEPGKFDLVYQNPDGSERVEYAVTRGSRVTERWESLLEPRLII